MGAALRPSNVVVPNGTGPRRKVHKIVKPIVSTPVSANARPDDRDRLVLPEVHVVDVDDVDDREAKAATRTAIGMAPKIAAISATTSAMVSAIR